MPRMRFVPIKTAEQQCVRALYRLREGLEEERAVCSNRNRGSGPRARCTASRARPGDSLLASPGSGPARNQLRGYRQRLWKSTGQEPA